MLEEKVKTKMRKAKGERRKQRKVAAALAELHAKETDEPLAAQPANQASDEDVEMGLPEEQAPPQTKRRKRKISDASERAVGSPQERSPTQDVLTAFPEPVQPAPPSQSVLYLQGLDKAIIEAEVVNADQVLSLDDPELSDKMWLSDKTKKRLGELGISELFPVQTALLSFLLPPGVKPTILSPWCPFRDACASAPTGSGKTLAYVLPIVETLSVRIVTRLRALVVLPTRDLVSQVRETFETICKGRGLKIGVATGHHSFAHEQSQLVNTTDYTTLGGSSKVDILICTPGRLIDHIHGTPNFTLQHLRFLVMDEADRLITQSFQDWLTQVLEAIRSPSSEAMQARLPSDQTENGTLRIPHHDALAPHWMHTSGTYRSLFHTDLDETQESSCQKLLFSATLTKDPSRIAALNLRDPKYFIVKGSDEAEQEEQFGESFMMPASLSEHMIVCDPMDKPLVLFHLMLRHSVTNALVFTKSAESTTRLMRLLEFFEKARLEGSSDEADQPKPKVAKAYSSDLSPGERKSLLGQFKNSQIDLLICSDLISRGMDISQVSHVVSYDTPVDMRKYVHRVGRTARAGRSGDAWSLVEEQEAHYFKKMLKSANHLPKVKKLRLKEADLAPWQTYYQVALGMLKEVYSNN